MSERFEPILPLPKPTEEDLARLDESAKYWQRPDVLLLLALRDQQRQGAPGASPTPHPTVRRPQQKEAVPA